MGELFAAIIELIFSAIDVFRQWRFAVCHFGALLIAGTVMASIGHHSWNWMVAATILVTGTLIGWRWEAST